MKKTLALVLALALVFSTVTVAFAEEPATVGADAKVCTDLGMLVGDGSGVTPAYLTTNPTRIQAAVMVLRLRGLEAEAKAFTGEGNFADADKAAWAKPIMGYLKAHPELGWVGDGTNFNPTANITAKEYYKAMLETLGYKQNTATVVGDFTWENVVEFATGKGLANAAATTFTVNDLAVATVETLKANTKEGGKTLVASLVEAGKVAKDAAVAAGVYTEAATTTAAALKTVKPLGNTAVEVEFTAEVEKAFAENAANYSIVEAADTTKVLEVKSALINGTKKAVLETAAQTAGKTYTVAVGDVKINFGGKAKVTGAPELDKVLGTDTETVELTFDRVLDFATATNVATYTITGVTVEKAEIDSAKKVVTLTTKGLVAGKSYTVKVANIKSVDGAILKSASKSFYSKSDKVAPKVDTATALTFKRVELKFNELVTTESAENIENYTIKAGSTELAIEKIVDVTESSDDVTTVEITTEAQKSGTKYEVSVLNVVDQSVLANKITRESKKSFTGKAEDKAAPTLDSPAFDYVARNMAIVYFADGSRLDKESALTLSNYTFNNDITIEKVEQLPGADENFKSVLLTTSEFGAKSSYELKVAGVRDEYGNEMKEKKSTKTYVKANAIASAQVSKVYASKSTEVVIEFSKEVDATTAKDVANYSIDKDVATPLTAKVDDYCRKVTLTVPEMVAGTKYTITINGVKDLAGNTLTGVKPTFYGVNTTNDLDAPVAEDITAVNNTVVRVGFDEEVKATLGTASIDIRPVAGGSTTTLVAKVKYEDNTVIEFSTSTPSAVLSDVEYEIIDSTGITDKAGTPFAPAGLTVFPSFYGLSEDPDKLDFSWEQVNVNKFKLTFSENVKVKAGAPANFKGLLYKADDIDEEPNVYFLYMNSAIKVDRTFTDDINAYFVSYHNVAINNLDDDGVNTTFTANIEDTDDPYITNVEAQYRDKIVITFNEDLRTYGAYTVKYFDENGKEKSVNFTTDFYNGTTFNKVKLTLATGQVLDANYTYTLKVTTGVVDLAGNGSEKDEEYTFEGSDLTQVNTYATGVEVINGTQMIVYTGAWTGTQVVNVVYGSPTKTVFSNGTMAKDATTDYTGATINIPTATVDTLTVPLQAFSSDVTYTVNVGSMKYEFKGIVDAGVNVAYNSTTSEYELSYSDMTKDDIIVLVYNKDDVTDATNTNIAYTVLPGDVTNGYWSTAATSGAKYDILVVRGSQVVFYDRGVQF